MSSMHELSDNFSIVTFLNFNELGIINGTQNGVKHTIQTKLDI